jgi:DNA-binding transcriptional regulator YiaG
LFLNTKDNQQAKVTKTFSQTTEKKPSKYCKTARILQSKIIEESSNLSQRQLAQKYNIPNTTLQHWIDRQRKLKGKKDPHVVTFFESPSGQAWLHKMALAAFMVFHQNGNSGIPDMHEFFEMSDVSMFVGTSVSALQKVSKTIDKQIYHYENKEVERLAQDMPHKNITGALDENFIMDEMTLILMEPVSGYILSEQIEEKRDAETWNKVTQVGIRGLNVTIQQLIGDEASGLTKLATCSLKVLKGSDLFHIQQEITKGLTSHLARTLEQVKKKQEDLQKERLEMLARLRDQLTQVEGIHELSKKGTKAGNRLIEVKKEETANRKKIKIAEVQYKTAQEARRSITDDYHPFNLDTGERQTQEVVKVKLEKSYVSLEVIATEASCTDKQKQKLEKSKGSLESMLAVLAFFFSFLALMIKSMGLNEAHGQLFEQLVSMQYLNICLKKTKKTKQKERIEKTIKTLKEMIGQSHLWREISEGVQTEWWSRALECAQVFQRSSSCVEGRNGQLSLKFHAFRRVNADSLKVLTILHNFFIRRADGTTAAERFFGNKPRDLFTCLLNKVELPRPRKKHKRRAKNNEEKKAI